MHPKHKRTAKKVVSVSLILLAILSIFGITYYYVNKEQGTTAYSRNTQSGTYDAFSSEINYDNQKWSNNVLEVSGSDAMRTKVDQTYDSIGYDHLYSVTDGEGEVHSAFDFEVAYYNGVEPTAENALSGDYEFTTTYNMFFRVSPETYFTYYLPASWDPEEGWDDDALEALGNANTDETSDEYLVAWLYFNWVLYGETAMEIIPLPIQDENNYTMTSEDVDHYITTTGLSGKTVEVTSNGSNSVLLSVEKTLWGDGNPNDPEEGSFLWQTNVNSNMDVTWVLAHNGSGDAMSSQESITGQIGFQSRWMKESEVDNWNKDKASGGYSYTYYDMDADATWEKDKIPYASYELDAIVIIYNYDTPEDHVMNLTTDQVREIYINGGSITEDMFTHINDL